MNITQEQALQIFQQKSKLIEMEDKTHELRIPDEKLQGILGDQYEKILEGYILRIERHNVFLDATKMADDFKLNIMSLKTTSGAPKTMSNMLEIPIETKLWDSQNASKKQSLMELKGTNKESYLYKCC